jgi:hypothetical protein
MRKVLLSARNPMHWVPRKQAGKNRVAQHLVPLTSVAVQMAPAVAQVEIVVVDPVVLEETAVDPVVQMADLVGTAARSKFNTYAHFVSNGSGLYSPNGPNSDGSSNTGNGSNGPAPNSGDGIADGSDIDSPNGPNQE